MLLSNATRNASAHCSSRLFPLQAYRSLPADTTAEEFGLEDPEIRFRIEDSDGRDHEVLLGQAAVARWWLARFRFGPLEWLWRSATWFRWEPLRAAPRPADA